jgi:WhiB family redox-sensing transcriptional regulator
MRDPEWRERAICRGVDTETFYLQDRMRAARARAHEAAAKAVCAQCPVRQECLEYAVRNNELFGVWGGLTAAERLGVRGMSA